MTVRLLVLMVFLTGVACGRAERLDPDSGQALIVDPAKPPNGAQLVQILLENQSLPLKGTGCSSIPNDSARLQHLLARTFGGGIDDPNLQTAHAARCEPAQFEQRAGAPMDVWQCHIYLQQRRTGSGVQDKTVESATHASVSFGVTKDTWKLVVDSVTPPSPLICTP